MTVVLSVISAEPLDVDRHLRAVEHRSAGAVTSFVGRVRESDPDASTPVTALEYSAHPDAEAALAAIAERAVGGTGARVAVSHRVGRLGVGDAAVVIAVSSPHRSAAFDVCRTLIETIKTDLPVWKKQHEEDGSSTWKGLGG